MLDSKLNGRIDVTRDTRIDLETKFLVGTDNPGSPNIQAGLARLPIFTTWGGTAGLGHRFNRFDVAAKGGAERTVYQDSHFTDGTTASNEDRNYNRFNAQLRGSYELTPGVKPFVEVGADRRVHDLEIDFSGVQRNSNGRYVKGGTTFELTRILTGDIAVGWLDRRLQDPTLPNIAGLTFDASLTWVASALTTAKLTAITRADESRVFGVSGVFTREVTLQVDHAFRRWLIATGKFVYGNDDYVGSRSRRQPLFGVGRDHLQAHPRAVAEVRVPPRLAALLDLRQQLRRGRHPVRAAAAAVRGRADVVLVAQTRDQAICSGAAKPPYSECPAGLAKLPSLRRRGLGRGCQQCRVRSRRDLESRLPNTNPSRSA